MNEQISKTVNHPWFIPVLVGLTSLGSGLGIGYILGKKKVASSSNSSEQLQFDFDNDGLSQIRDSLDKMKAERELRNKQKQWEKIELRDDEVRVVDVEEKPPLENHSNYVDEETYIPPDSTDEGWDYEIEIAGRNPSEPYIIHKDEFYADEMNFTQTTLTYYAGDNIMADEEDVPLYNFETVTGPLRFGHGADDPNVVHIRNERRKAEYEVIHNDGMFSREVLGLEIEDNARVDEIQHSKNRKFKLD